MQNNTIVPLDLSKKQMYSRQFDAPPSPNGGMCNQLHEQEKTKQQLRPIAKSEKSKPLVAKLSL